MIQIKTQKQKTTVNPETRTLKQGTQETILTKQELKIFKTFIKNPHDKLNCYRKKQPKTETLKHPISIKTTQKHGSKLVILTTKDH